MAFISWENLRESLKDALADYVSSGSPITKEYSIGGRKHVIRDVKELKDLIKLTYEMEDLENSGSYTVSYGRFKRI